MKHVKQKIWEKAQERKQKRRPDHCHENLDLISSKKARFPANLVLQTFPCFQGVTVHPKVGQSNISIHLVKIPNGKCVKYNFHLTLSRGLTTLFPSYTYVQTLLALTVPNTPCDILLNSPKLSLQYPCIQVGRILIFILDKLLCMTMCFILITEQCQTLSTLNTPYDVLLNSPKLSL